MALKGEQGSAAPIAVSPRIRFTLSEGACVSFDIGHAFLEQA